MFQESQRSAFENQREEIIHSHVMEKEDMMNSFEREREDLQTEIVSVQRDRDEALLLAENDKQQVCGQNQILDYRSQFMLKHKLRPVYSVFSIKYMDIFENV